MNGGTAIMGFDPVAHVVDYFDTDRIFCGVIG